MVDSTEFALVQAEAEDIARSVNQRLTTAHLLLAAYTAENRAQRLLRERGIDEDRILEALTSAPVEAEGLAREACDKAREIAGGCGSPETDCLHLLIAMTRVRCLGQELLAKVGLDLSALRNTALSYYLGGRMPRKLLPAREPPASSPRAPGGRPLGAPPSMLPSSRATNVAAVAPISARDLFDDEPEAEGAPAPAPATLVAPSPSGVR